MAAERSGKTASPCRLAQRVSANLGPDRFIALRFGHPINRKVISDNYFFRARTITLAGLIRPECACVRGFGR
jgi:hypothetical protein